ncbi:MAG: hypothetical protein JKX70_08500 [Phycisphaerales bacterium]|nr:hypothetical protein [Phycisphaerales bacterium]
MSEAPRENNPSSSIPHMTSLSIAFPMNFESANPESNDPRRATTKATKANRAPHRHDAGK